MKIFLWQRTVSENSHRLQTWTCSSSYPLCIFSLRNQRGKNNLCPKVCIFQRWLTMIVWKLRLFSTSTTTTAVGSNLVLGYISLGPFLDNPMSTRMRTPICSWITICAEVFSVWYTSESTWRFGSVIIYGHTIKFYNFQVFFPYGIEILRY